MEKKKKTWTEPKLTALVRRKPEEGILTACKNFSGEGPSVTESGCRMPVTFICDTCATHSST